MPTILLAECKVEISSFNPVPSRYEDTGVVPAYSARAVIHMFRAWATRYVDVDAPGATSANLQSLGHARVRRPVVPLDPDVPFRPRAALFRRG